MNFEILLRFEFYIKIRMLVISVRFAAIVIISNEVSKLLSFLTRNLFQNRLSNVVTACNHTAIVRINQIVNCYLFEKSIFRLHYRYSTLLIMKFDGKST